MELDEKKELLELVSKGINIPLQPRVLNELRTRMMKGNEDIRGLAQIIAQDPGITAMLFRVARSPMFGGKRLETLNQVLTTIGVKNTYNLVWAAALTTTITSDKRKAFEVFWERSEEVAQLCALIAKDRVYVCNVFQEQAYLAGKFYMCGIPVLMLRFNDYCSVLNLEGSLAWPNLTEEDARFNVDHGTIGYLVARHWQLPDFICNAIRYHYELPPVNEVDTTRALTAILILGSHYYHQRNLIPEPLWPDIRAEVLAELGIDDEDEEENFQTKIIGFYEQF